MTCCIHCDYSDQAPEDKYGEFHWAVGSLTQYKQDPDNERGMLYATMNMVGCPKCMKTFMVPYIQRTL